MLKSREAASEEEASKLVKDREQLMRVLDQIYTLHTTASKKTPLPSSSPDSTSPTSIPCTSESLEEEKETVRALLREAASAEDLQHAAGKARLLDMSFEVSLAERKLAKLSQ